MSAQHDRRPAAPRGRVAAPHDRDAEAEHGGVSKRRPRQEEAAGPRGHRPEPGRGRGAGGSGQCGHAKDEAGQPEAGAEQQRGGRESHQDAPARLLERLCQRGETEHKQYGCGGHKEVEGLPRPLLPLISASFSSNGAGRRGTGRERRPRHQSANDARSSHPASSDCVIQLVLRLVAKPSRDRAGRSLRVSAGRWRGRSAAGRTSVE
jgi:hypothetical protein